MDRWLAAAEKLLGRRTSLAAPAPFEVQCACGKTVSGERTSTAQTVVCPDCAAFLFVLPASAYPPPKVPRRNPLIGRKAKPEVAVAAAPRVAEESPRLALEDEEPAAPPTPMRPPPASTERHSAPPAALAGGNRNALNFSRVRRRILTPVRLVLAGVFCVVGLMTSWIVHVHALNEAERTIGSASKLGEQALREHDQGEAARQYQRVRRALDLLGRHDAEAQTLRQIEREISASADLARASLFDILHEAVVAEGTSRAGWEQTFQSSYRGEWVLLDARVSRSSQAGGRRYEIEFPIVEGSNRATVVADLAIFDQALPRGGTPQRVIFAAQLDDCRRDPQDAGAWQIVMRPSTGFLWSSADNIALLGVPLDESTKELLADQTSHLSALQ